jgi:glyoxylase-like metal-dependent hydrolase (beta-lactamase superfamily II)
MKKTQITEIFYQYQFPPVDPDHHFGFNIFALLGEGKALLIDTAFEEHASAVMDDLSTNDHSVQAVIISHFHDDHLCGLRALPKGTIIGSELYEEMLDGYDDPEEARRHFAPTDLVKDGMRMAFGDFELSFLSAPGHSPCTIYTVINNQYVHVADNIMSSNDGQPILPWAKFECIPDHIESLAKLEAFQGCTILPSHGKVIAGKSAILAEIDQRLKYLQAVWESGGSISYEEATASCSRDFLHGEWHSFG